jgi:hypothetical protein
VQTSGKLTRIIAARSCMEPRSARMDARGMTWMAGSVCATAVTTGRRQEKAARKTYCTLYTMTTHKEVVDGVHEMRV